MQSKPNLRGKFYELSYKGKILKSAPMQKHVQAVSKHKYSETSTNTMTKDSNLVEPMNSEIYVDNKRCKRNKKIKTNI